LTEMRIKSYFVRSTGEALAQAREELGDDALLLNTRRVNPQPGSLVQYEVVFGCPDATDDSENAAAQDDSELKDDSKFNENVESGPLAVAKSAEAAADLEQIRAQIRQIHGLLLSAGTLQTGNYGIPFLDGVLARMLQAGCSNAFARGIVDRVAAAFAVCDANPEPENPLAPKHGSGRVDQERLYGLLRKELSSQVKIDSRLGVDDSGGAVVALVGPGGSGKTTTLMKIAAFQSGPDRPVRLLTLNCTALGHLMELQLFARKNGIAFTAVDSPEALPALIEDARQNAIVLIDTPGHQPAADREKIGEALARCPEIDVHLVLSGYMRADACREAMQRYKVFRPAKLVLTKLDETDAFGAAISEAAGAGLSLSLISSGSSVPQDLYSVSIDDLMAIALPGRAQPACA
jgi:flagellar biosynthesis protein FlhF